MRRDPSGMGVSASSTADLAAYSPSIASKLTRCCLSLNGRICFVGRSEPKMDEPGGSI